MEYNREYWKPRIATNPNRFRKLNESNDYVELINEPEAISQAGTAFTADRLNNMEAGIEGVVAEVNEIQGVLDFTGQVPTFAGNADTADKWKTARNISISDADGTNTGSAVSVDGSENETLKLPATIKANLTGNADTATLATRANAIKPLGNSIVLPATPTSVTKIIKIATVDVTYNGSINITCRGANIEDGIKVCINGAHSLASGIRVIYGKNNTTYGIKKIIVTRATEIWNSPRNIYAEIATSPNDFSTTTLGVVETNHGTFTPSMTEVSSVEGTVLDSLSLDYLRGDISSYQHVFTKSPTAPTPATETNNTQIATTAFVKNQKYAPINNPTFTGTVTAPLLGKTHINDGTNTSLIRGSGYLTIGNLDGANMSIDENEIIAKSNGTTPGKLYLNSYGGDVSIGGATSKVTAPTPATATNNTQIATTAFVKNQKYEPNRGTGTNSLALVANSEASGDSSIALGANSEASGASSIALGWSSTASRASSIALGWSSTASRDSSIALGGLSTASGYCSIALGYGAEAPRDYQITIGTKFVYLRFPSTETEATVYNALSPWVFPASGRSQGAMGVFGANAITRIFRNSSTSISLYDNDNSQVKTINSGNTSTIGSDLAICTVKY